MAAVTSGRSSGPGQPAYTGSALVRAAQSRTIRALRSVSGSGTLPATAVRAFTSSRLPAPSANKIAIASSCPGSVSMIMLRDGALESASRLRAIAGLPGTVAARTPRPDTPVNASDVSRNPRRDAWDLASGSRRSSCMPCLTFDRLDRFAAEPIRSRKVPKLTEVPSTESDNAKKCGSERKDLSRQEVDDE